MQVDHVLCAEFLLWNPIILYIPLKFFLCYEIILSFLRKMCWLYYLPLKSCVCSSTIQLVMLYHRRLYTYPRSLIKCIEVIWHYVAHISSHSHMENHIFNSRKSVVNTS